MDAERLAEIRGSVERYCLPDASWAAVKPVMLELLAYIAQLQADLAAAENAAANAH